MIGTLALAAPVYLFRSKTRWWVALIIGFVLFNVVAGGIFGLWAYINFDWVAGLIWFLGKTFGLVFLFVWMRGTLPRVRIDQLMGFAWKWLLPGVAAQPVRDRGRGPRHRRHEGGPEVSLLTGLVPGLGLVKGMALTLRRFFAPKATVMYPEMPADVATKFRGRLQLLYDEYGGLKCETCFQCAQACPIECIDMGGMDTKGRFHVHWGPPETYGERREESALRRSGRTVPDQAYEHFAPFDIATRRRDPGALRPRPEAHAPDPRGDAGDVRVPAGRGAEADQRAHGRVVRHDLRHRLVLRPPALRAARRPRPQAKEVRARRATDEGYLAGARRLARRRASGDA